MKRLELIIIIWIVIGVLGLSWIVFSPKLKFLSKKPLTTTGIEEVTPKEEPYIEVRTLRITRTDFEDMLPVMGTARGYLEIELKFENPGIVKAIKVREGDKVKRGDLLASLEDKDALLKLEYAKKKLASAEASYLTTKKKKELYQGLFQAGAIIKAKLEEAGLEAEAAKSQVKMVAAEVDLARQELRKTYLFAPKDGIVGTKDIEVGEFTSPQNKVFSLFDLKSVYVEIGIVEKDIDKVKIGQKVGVTLDSYPQEQFEGKIENLLPLIEGRSRTLTAKVRLDNPKGIILPGMFSRANIFMAELENAIMVPRASLLELMPGSGVQIIPIVDYLGQNKEDIEKGLVLGEVQLRQVTAGYFTSDFAQIIKGLSEGELVIIEAKGELKQGAKVKVVNIEEPFMPEISPKVPESVR